MSKKKKRGQMSSTFKTTLIAAAVFMVAAVGCIAYGLTAYHSDKVVSSDDIVTGVTSTITGVEKRERNLSVSEKEREKKNGMTDDEIRWEYYVTYTVEDGGNTYTYYDIKPYREKKSAPKVGDTDVINYAIIDGEFVPHPETSSINTATVSGVILAVLSLISLGVGLFIRK